MDLVKWKVGLKAERQLEKDGQVLIIWLDKNKRKTIG